MRVKLVIFTPNGYFVQFRSENGKLKRHNEELQQRWKRAMARLKDLEDQTEQHSRVQEKMTERLKMMDDHAQHQGQQVKQDFLLLEEWFAGSRGHWKLSYSLPYTTKTLYTCSLVRALTFCWSLYIPKICDWNPIYNNVPHHHHHHHYHHHWIFD